MKNKVYGFNQEEALKIKKRTVDANGKVKDLSLDFIDLVILRWFIDFYPKMGKKVFNNEEYAWVRYDKVLEDLPLLNIKKRAVAQRMQKMSELGVLECKLLKMEKEGTFLYYKYGRKLLKLDADRLRSNAHGVVVQTATGSSSNSNGLSFKQPSIYNNIVKDNIVKDNKSTTSWKEGGIHI